MFINFSIISNLEVVTKMRSLTLTIDKINYGIKTSMINS